MWKSSAIFWSGSRDVIVRMRHDSAANVDEDNTVGFSDDLSNLAQLMGNGTADCSSLVMSDWL